MKFNKFLIIIVALALLPLSSFAKTYIVSIHNEIDAPKDDPSDTTGTFNYNPAKSYFPQVKVEFVYGTTVLPDTTLAPFAKVVSSTGDPTDAIITVTNSNAEDCVIAVGKSAEMQYAKKYKCHAEQIYNDTMEVYITQ